MPRPAVAIAVGLTVTRWMLPPSRRRRPRRQALRAADRAAPGARGGAFCAAVSEGAVADWSAILLADWRDASEGTAALGLTLFGATMGFGRLAADPLRERYRARAPDARPVRQRCWSGIVPVVVPLGIAPAVVGFAIMGAGLASLFPLALLLGSRVPGQSAAAGIAAVSTAGYAGFLAGPAAIGFLAEAASLPAGLGLLIPLAIAVALLAPRSCAVSEAVS